MSWEKIELGSVIKHRKEFIIIDNSIVYNRCRVQVNRKGIVLRDSIKGFLINTKKQQICKEGDFLVAEIDAKVGGYGFVPKELNGAIVSSHYFLFDVDETRMLKQYLGWLIKTDIIQDQITSKGSTNYAAIRPSHVLKFEVPLPSIKEQMKIVERLNRFSKQYSLIGIELGQQQNHIQELRQVILREVMQGKISQNNENENADTLLELVYEQKRKLTEAGKLKKGKELRPISENQISFKLPIGWIWCRLNDIADVGTGGTPLTSKKEYYNGNIPWITSSATGSLFVSEAEKFITIKALKETNCKVFPIGTLIVAMYGQGKTRGQITELLIEAATNQACASIDLIIKNNAHKEYIKYFFQKIYLEIRELAAGGAQPNLNLQKIKETLIPLPPLSEQKRIVDMLSLFFQTLNKLDQQVTKSILQTQQLLHTVLLESFSEKNHKPS